MIGSLTVFQWLGSLPVDSCSAFYLARGHCLLAEIKGTWAMKLSHFVPICSLLEQAEDKN